MLYVKKSEDLLVSKVAETIDNYFSALPSTLEEWNSDEDKEAWCDLQTVWICGRSILIFWKFFIIKRPAVILTFEAYNSSHPNMVLAMIDNCKKFLTKWFKTNQFKYYRLTETLLYSILNFYITAFAYW